MIEFFDIEQNTDEWLDLRAGKPTGSKAGVIMANLGKAFSDTAKKYAVNIAIEQITGNRIPSDYNNGHMARGHLQEPIACAYYEDRNFVDVMRGGFFLNDGVGISPDGLVGDNGLIEIKSVIPTVQFANVKRGKVDPAYKWQTIFQVKYCEKEWLDFVSFCDLYPEDKKLFTCRLLADNLSVEFKQVDERVEQFKELIEKTKEEIMKG